VECGEVLMINIGPRNQNPLVYGSVVSTSRKAREVGHPVLFLYRQTPAELMHDAASVDSALDCPSTQRTLNLEARGIDHACSYAGAGY